MRRASVCVVAAIVALSASEILRSTSGADEARAEEPAKTAPADGAAPTVDPYAPPPEARQQTLWDWRARRIGIGGALSFGLASIDRGDWNDELVAAGRPPIISLVGDLGARAFIDMEGFNLALAGAFLFDVSDRGHGPQTDLLGGSVFGELSYDLVRGLFLTLGPSFGVGWERSSFCVHGEPNPVALPPGSPRHREVLFAPGAESCLSADTVLVRPGLVAGVAMPLSQQPNGDAGFMNLRPQYAIPVSQSDYSLEGSSDFTGPTPPHASFSVVLELGLVFGAGERIIGL